MGFGEMIVTGLILIPVVIFSLGMLVQLGAFIVGLYYMVKAIKEKLN